MQNAGRETENKHYMYVQGGEASFRVREFFYKVQGDLFFLSLGPAPCSVACTAARASQKEQFLDVSSQMYRKHKLDVQTDFHTQKPPCWVSFGKATTCTDLLRMCLCNVTCRDFSFHT